MRTEEKESNINKTAKGEKRQQIEDRTTRSPSLSPLTSSEDLGDVTNASMAMLSDTDEDTNFNKGQVTSLQVRIVSPVTATNTTTTSNKKPFCIENILTDKISSLHQRRQGPPCILPPTSLYRVGGNAHFRPPHFGDREGVTVIEEGDILNNHKVDFVNEQNIVSSRLPEDDVYVSSKF